MSDSKPQVKEESGEVAEETYDDACSGELRHSVSDVYVSLDVSGVFRSQPRLMTTYEFPDLRM